MADICALRSEVEKNIAEVKREIGYMSRASRPEPVDSPIGQLPKEDDAKGLATQSLMDAKERLRALEELHARLAEPDENFGKCEICGGNIETARLLANPAIARCGHCSGT